LTAVAVEVAWLRWAATACLALTAWAIPLSTSGMQLGIVALGVLALVATWLGMPIVRRTPLDEALLVLLLALGASTLAGGFDAPGWSRPWVVVAYFAVYWWIEDARTAERFVRWLVMASCVVAVYGIIQHYTGADWYRELLGRRRAVHPRIEGAHGYASVGFFRNYLTFAHVLIIPLGFALVSCERWMRLAAVPLLGLAIVFSTARGAWIAVVAMALGALVAGRGAALRVLLLVAVGAFAVGVSPGLRQQILPALTSAEMNAGRLGIYRANLDIVRDHPLFGLGFGRYQRAARPYYARHPEADRRSHAHNNFLQIAAEAGLVGLAAFTLLFATMLRFGIDAVRRCRDPNLHAVALGGCLALVGFLVGGLTQYSFGDNEVATAMWTTAAVLMRLRDVGR
jgi:O-antigen ligase